MISVTCLITALILVLHLYIACGFFAVFTVDFHDGLVEKTTNSTRIVKENFRISPQVFCVAVMLSFFWEVFLLYWLLLAIGQILRNQPLRIKTK